MQPPVFPALRIEGDEELLLAPYRAATAAMAEALVQPGLESNLKAPALRGLQPDTVEAWDAAFATLGLRWANLGAYSATDPFLCALEPQGFVPSQLSVSQGECNLPAGDRARPAAPLLAMAEWELFKLRGDRERLAHAFELLYADFQWREQNLRRRNGLLGGTAAPYRLASTGRFTLGGRIVPSLANGAYWVDACGMYALNLRVLSEMALLLGRKEQAGEAEWAMRDVAARMNALMWSEDDGFYYDLDEHGSPLPMRTLAAVWAVWSGVAPRAHADKLLLRVLDGTQFERAHPFATVSAAEGDYRRRDGTPVGVSRPDFNLLVAESLFATGRAAKAQRAAEAHLRHVARILQDSGELYLAHDPDRNAPAPLPDGASGANAPLARALLVQTTLGVLLGLRPHGHRGELELCPYLQGKHAVEGVVFNTANVNIEVAAADKSGGRRAVEVMTDAPLKLRLRVGDTSHLHDLKPGLHTLHA